MSLMLDKVKLEAVWGDCSVLDFQVGTINQEKYPDS